MPTGRRTLWRLPDPTPERTPAARPPLPRSRPAPRIQRDSGSAETKWTEKWCGFVLPPHVAGVSTLQNQQHGKPYYK
jgi:hypothetical protein